MKDVGNHHQPDDAAQACPHDIEIVQTLTEAIVNRWQEAQLEPAPDDHVKAGLAALEFLDTARDSDSPWDLGDVASVIDIDRGSSDVSTTRDARDAHAPRGANTAS